MLGNILPPYHTLQELNLDWILTKVKNMLRFLPDDGAVGQILRRTQTGAEWSDEQGAGGSVTSVNGMQGDVVLDKNDIGLGNVDNVQQYSASNPPPYPVTSVNGQTGAVSLSIPDSTSDLVNDSGFVDAAGAAAAAPVQSVNGQTGAVSISLPHLDLLWTNPNPTSSFGAQTIPLDLSEYPYFFVMYKSVTTATRVLSQFVVRGIDWTMFIGSPSGASPTYIQLQSRSIDSDVNGVTFSNGYHGYTSGYSNNDPNACVPVYIYGVKGV